MSSDRHSYVGRFAPSPTGPLHLGSLLSAVASFLDARAAGGRWLVRMEDLDPPREQPGAAGEILACLRAHGLCADTEVLWQSRRSEAYESALAGLRGAGRVFPCSCSRAQLMAHDGRHPGRCRGGKPPYALRFEVWDQDLCFTDRLQGQQRENLSRTCGDFVVRRKDGLYAYQLAVVVDDAYQGVTDVVRGCDLLGSTPRQLALQQALELAAPRYLHLPVLINREGQKLSKQTGAPALDPHCAGANLRRVLGLLGQPAPPSSAREPDAILTSAAAHWCPAAIPAQASLASPG